MKIQHDQESNAIYLTLKDSDIEPSEIAKSQSIAPGVICDFDSSGNLIGIEIMLQHRNDEPILIGPYTWEEFKQIEQLLDKPGVQLSFLDGVLEIKKSGWSANASTSVNAGTKEVLSYEERRNRLKGTRLGKILGLDE